MDGLVVIWGIASLAFGIALVVLWLDTGPTRDACDELERRVRELEGKEGGEEMTKNGQGDDLG